MNRNPACCNAFKKRAGAVQRFLLPLLVGAEHDPVNFDGACGRQFQDRTATTDLDVVAMSTEAKEAEGVGVSPIQTKIEHVQLLPFSLPLPFTTRGVSLACRNIVVL